MVDRLRLTDARIEAMAGGLRQVAALPDPVGEVLDGWVRPNGLRIQRVRVPLGVVAIIYENRPNVTSRRRRAVPQVGQRRLPAGLVGRHRAPTSPSPRCCARRVAKARPARRRASCWSRTPATRPPSSSCGCATSIDCLIPRGGPSLIASILDNATVPYVIDGDGNCHVYVDAAADLDMARRHRRQRQDAAARRCATRPSRCSCTTRVADAFLPHGRPPRSTGVELVGDDGAARARAGASAPPTDDDFGREFLDLKLAVAVVAVARRGHRPHQPLRLRATPRRSSPRDLAAADRFTREVDAAAVLVNASTRFADGEEFGFGAEIGICTQKLHARGPMGLRELTTAKYVVRGDGQIRG